MPRDQWLYWMPITGDNMYTPPVYVHPTQTSYGKVVLSTGDQGMVRDETMHVNM